MKMMTGSGSALQGWGGSASLVDGLCYLWGWWRPCWWAGGVGCRCGSRSPPGWAAPAAPAGIHCTPNITTISRPINISQQNRTRPISTLELFEIVFGSVADPGNGAFLTPGSWILDPDPGWRKIQIQDSGWRKIQIQDPGSGIWDEKHGFSCICTMQKLERQRKMYPIYLKNTKHLQTC